MSRGALIAGSFVTALTLLTGTLVLLGESATTTRRDPIEFNGVKAVRLELANGGVTIRGAKQASVSGTRAVTRSFSRPTYTETVTPDGTLVLRTRCRSLFAINCEVDYELTVPANIPIRGFASGGDIKLNGLNATVSVNASAGSVSATNMTGDLTLSSSAGDVLVDRSKGKLELSSSAGDVTVKNASASRAVASSSAGDVRFSFTDAPANIEADSSAGDVTVEVPRSSAGYSVDARTTAGDEKVSIKTDPESALRMKLRSTAGNVVVRYSTLQ